MKEPIRIATGFRSDYATIAVAMFKSLEKLNENYEINLLVDNDFLSHNNIISLIYNSLKPNSNVSIKLVNVEDRVDLSKIEQKIPARYALNSMYRLFLPDLLPYDRIIYLDGDAIVLESLKYLNDLDLGDKLIAGARDYALNDIEKLKQWSICHFEDFSDLRSHYNYHRYYLKFSDSEIEDYVDAGVLVFNLKQMRQINWSHRVMQFVSTPFLYLDQDMLNILVKNSKIMLDEDWNMCTKRWEQREDCLSYNPKIFHPYCTTHGKPWINCLGIGSDLYWQNVRDTCFYEDAILRLVSNQKQKIFGISNVNKDSKKVLLTNGIQLNKSQIIFLKKFVKLFRNPWLFFKDSWKNLKKKK